MPTLGLAMIAKNEEKSLPRLLESIKGCFDEMVIIDTGSSDRTKEIAISYGAKVYDFEWIDDFAAARNFSFSKVTSEWTMWMDADDELRPEDRARLIALKPELGKADAYLMMYDYAQDEFDKPICKFYRHRIVKTNPRVRWELPIHEHLCIIPGTKEAMTNVVITHRRTGEGATADRGRNIRMLRKALIQHPDNQRVKFYLGKELYNEGSQEESIRILEDYLTKGDWHENQVNAYFWLAMDYLTQKKEDKAIDAALRGVKLDPRWAEFYCLIGQIYYDRSDWGTAIRWFEIAASCPVPETWGTVILDNYTWVPRDRLCKCYSEIGNVRKAYEWNESSLSYRPEDKRLLFNRHFLRDNLYDRLSPRPVRLNLGSGGKPASGWRNCDLYMGDGVQFQMDQSLIPYDDGVVHAIRSEHALEHSDSHYRAEETVGEWARALRYGGHLHLMVPDLDECCKKFVESEDRPRKAGERWTQKEWYKYTIYGIQVGQAHEPDDGQYHRTGFTLPGLTRLLKTSGFEILKAETYDGFGTPSLEVEAIQTAKEPRVAWMLRSGNEDDPSTRIRRTNISRWLATHGIQSELVPNYHVKDEGGIVSQVRHFDVVVFTYLSDLERRVMEKLNLTGVTTMVDYNEDLVDLHPEIAPCLEAAQVIVCCSKTLAEKATKYGRTIVISDAYETTT